MQTWDVFLSYNSQDKPAVRELATYLMKRGLRVWFDEWELVPGRPWQDVLEVMVKQTRTVAVLVGSEGIGPWQNVEMRAFLASSVKKGLPIIPVLLPDAPSRVDLPIFLEAFTWVDFRDGIAGEGLERLVWGITGKRSREPSPPPANKAAYRPGIVGLKLDEVFRTVGLPLYTYIEPTIYRRFAYALGTPGKHLVLEGPSGVGKTCMVFRALEELGYSRHSDYEYISARDKQGSDRIVALSSAALVAPATKLVVIDDVHMLQPNARSQLANQLKLLSDAVFLAESTTKFVLVGIPTASAAILFNAVDLGPRLSTYKLDAASDRQLRQLIEEGEKRLAVRFQDPDAIIKEAGGSFHLCQYICHEVCFNEGVLDIQPDIKVLRYRIDDVRRVLLDELHDRYGQQILGFCKGHRWHLKEVSGFMALLASLSRRNKPVVNLNELLIDAGPYADLLRSAAVSLVPSGEDDSASLLVERLLHYDDGIQTFSIEDPAFWYYICHFDVKSVMSALGLADARFEAHYATATASRAGMEEPAELKSAEPARDSVFISYSHADAAWMTRLRTHLAPLLRAGTVSLWSDTQIRAGSDWLMEIDRAIDVARVAVLLVSANYLASDFVSDKELPRLLARAQQRGLRILWVPISPCLWSETPIARYQSVLNPKRSLAELPKSEQEKRLVEISKAIRDELARAE